MSDGPARLARPTERKDSSLGRDLRREPCSGRRNAADGPAARLEPARKVRRTYSAAFCAVPVSRRATFFETFPPFKLS